MTLAELTIDFKNMIGPAGKGSEVSDTGIGIWLQEAYEDVVDEINRVAPTYFTKVVTTSLIINQKEYALPTDFVKMTQVEIDYLTDGNWTKAVPLPNIGQMPTYSRTDSGYSTATPVYYLQGSKIGIQPIPTQSGNNNMKIIYSYLVPEIAGSVQPSIPRGLQRKLKYLAYANYLDQNDEHVAAERMRVRFENSIQKFMDNFVINSEDGSQSVLVTHGSDFYSQYDL